MTLPFTTGTPNPCASSSRDSIRPPATPRTPSTSQSLKHRMSNIFNTPKRMSKRHNIPPPLAIGELTPPATIKRMSYYDPVQVNQSQGSLIGAGQMDSFEMLRSALSMTTPSISNFHSQSSIMSTECSVCNDSLRLRVQKEKIIVLSCDHSCHWDCFMIGGDSEKGTTVCFECGGISRAVKDDNVREEVLEELRANGMDQNEDEEELVKSIKRDETEDILVGIKSQTKEQQSSTTLQKSAVISLKANNISPHTPVNQIIRDEDILKKKETYLEISRVSFIDGPDATTTTGINDSFTQNFKMNNYSVGDLIKPEVNLLTEFDKYDVNTDQVIQEIGCVLNIFQGSNLQREEERKEIIAKELECKAQIHSYFLDLISRQLTLAEVSELNLTTLRQLTFFDSFQISVDGEHWEYTTNFLFGDSLILFNKTLTGVIGVVSITEHLISLSKQSKSVIVLYLSTQSLPELQIRSNNQILLDRWFTQIQSLSTEISLIKMSATLWSLLITDDSSIILPANVIKFNDLTHSGLDLPFQLIREILPSPQEMTLNLVLTIPLFNLTSDLSDNEYLDELKDSILNIVDSLKTEDNLGLILLGRDGSGNYGPHNSTYIGMVDKNYQGLGNLISCLQLVDLELENADMATVMKGCFKSCYSMFVMNGVEGGSHDKLNKLMILTNVSIDYDFETDKYLRRLITQHDLSINEILISPQPTLPLSLSSVWIEDIVYQCYHQYQCNSFKSFNDNAYHLVNKSYHFNYLNALQLDVRVNELFKSCVSINKVELNGVMLDIQGCSQLSIKTSELSHSNWNKNIRFDLSIDVPKFQELTHQGCEYSLLHLNFTINNFTEHSYYVPDHKLRINISTNSESSAVMGATFDDIRIPVYSPITIEPSSQTKSTKEDPYATDDKGQDESIFLDIPLLPLLSSSKDSIYVKRCIELYLIAELSQQREKNEDIDIQRLISVVWGLSKGCSSNYLNYWNALKTSFEEFVEDVIMKGLKGLLESKEKTEEDTDRSELFEADTCRFVNLLVQGGC